MFGLPSAPSRRGERLRYTHVTAPPGEDCLNQRRGQTPVEWLRLITLGS